MVSSQICSYCKYYFENFKNLIKVLTLSLSQPAITCLKLTIETLEQGVKYIQS